MRNPEKEKAAGGNQAAFKNNLQNDLYQHAKQTQPHSCALDEALDLAKINIPSFPCLPNKAPACAGGFNAATLDPAELRALFEPHPRGLIGVPTGSISGYDVLDIDPRHGGNEWLDANFPRLPATRIHQTRSGGVHIPFKHKEGLRNSAGRIARGVDVRAEGGYVIWWPAAGFPVLSDAPLADWPEWLLEALKPAPRAPFVPDTARVVDGDAYAVAALQRASIAVATAPEGTRNSTLNKEAYSLSRFVEDGRLRAQDIMSNLAAAALSSGLARPEIMATLVSALSARGLV